jgi:hypothetical protein
MIRRFNSKEHLPSAPPAIEDVTGNPFAAGLFLYAPTSRNAAAATIEYKSVTPLDIPVAYPQKRLREYFQGSISRQSLFVGQTFLTTYAEW